MTPADQSMAVIPESAPFTPAQRAWLNGFFAGLDAYPLPAGAAVPTPDESGVQPEGLSQVVDFKALLYVTMLHGYSENLPK